MAQTVTLQGKGLQLNANDLQNEGLSQADNVVLTKDGIIEPRRGRDTVQMVTSGYLRSLASSRGFIFSHENNAGTLNTYNASAGATATVSGTYVAPSGAPVRFAEAQQNLWFTTSTGVMKAYSAAGLSPEPAGLPVALDVDAKITTTGAAVKGQSQVAYRATFLLKDAAGAWLESAPAVSFVLVNEGVDANADVTVTIPTRLRGLSNAKVRIYRSDASVGVNVAPADEMRLAYEGPVPNATTVTITDTQPESLLGVSLYSNASQQGALQQNDPPPVASDVAFFQGCAFYANTQGPQRLKITLSATNPDDAGSVGGLAHNDVLTIAGVAYTANNPDALWAAPVGYVYTPHEDIAARKFALQSPDDAPTRQVSGTAASLARVINRNASSQVTARVVSGIGDVPGQIILEAPLGAGAFTAQLSASRANAFVPNLTNPVSSSADVWPNALFWSKQLQGDAVPLTNYQRIGSADKKILRIIALRDALVVLKEDGIWKVTGDGISFQVNPLDLTTILLAPESAVALDNAIFALTNHGIVRITENGVGIISRPVQPLVEAASTSDLRANVAARAFGVAYESDRKYLLWLPATAASTVCESALVYDLNTSQWTRRTDTARCGIVGPDDRMYLGANAALFRERKTFTASDFSDDGAAIQVGVAWTPKAGGNPGLLHHFREASFIFKSLYFTQATLGYWTNVSATPETIALTPDMYGWTGPVAQASLRSLVPLEKSRASQINLSWAQPVLQQPFQMQALSLVFSPCSQRVDF